MYFFWDSVMYIIPIAQFSFIIDKVYYSFYCANVLFNLPKKQGMKFTFSACKEMVRVFSACCLTSNEKIIGGKKVELD